MKFLEFIQSLVVPKYFIKRAKMNIFISILFLLICTYLVALPSFLHLKNSRYERFDTDFDFEVLDYCDDNSLLNSPVTDEERAKYNIISLSTFLNSGIQIEKSGYYFLEDSPFELGKEYVLKSVVPVKDDDGAITGYENYFVHIVFDTVNSTEHDNNQYDIAEKFDKLANDEDGVFRHFLIVFYENSFVYRNKDYQPTSISYISYLSKTYLAFNGSESATMDQLSKAMVDCLIPLYRTSYLYTALLSVFLFPILLSLIFSFVMKDSGNLKGYKEYFNFTAVCSIPLCLGIFIVSLISVPCANVFFKFYGIIFTIYYFVMVVYTNKRPMIQ